MQRPEPRKKIGRCVGEISEHEWVNAVAPPTAEVEAFLCAIHRGPVRDVQPLAAGFWSCAFAYSFDNCEFVLRLGSVKEGFEMDRAAMAFDRPDLPVPEVLEVGDALGRAYAISVRHHGRFLETIDPVDADVAAPAVERTLAALRSIPADRNTPTAWYPADASATESTWQRWLIDGLVDDPRRRVSGWRKTLAADPEPDDLFRTCNRKIRDLVHVCPERRDLVHGDLLNRNVLIAEDASRITAVFSWKCSVRGDFLFDVAWCTFWGAWHPGIAALDLWTRTLNSPSLSKDALKDAGLRHHCYELQIGASHLGWNAWTGNHDELQAVAAHISHVLSRGPLGASRT